MDLEKLRNNFAIQNPLAMKKNESSTTMLAAKYYNAATRVVSTVDYKLLDAVGNVNNEYNFAACFANISQATIPPEVDAILIHHKKELIPYNTESITRWINDINEIGFPCSYISHSDQNKDSVARSFDKRLLCYENILSKLTNCHCFFVKLDEYENKPHLVSTLMLIRALYERGICKVPDLYMQLMDNEPAADKLEILQVAHKTPQTYEDYANSNHMVTFRGNGNNVKKETLFGRFKACNFGVKQRDPGYSARISYAKQWEG